MKNQQGFTLIELMIVMFISSLLLVPMMNALMINIEERRINTTVAEISDLFQSAQTYAGDNVGVWPEEPTGCLAAITLLQSPAEGYLAGFNVLSVYGANYTTSCPVLGSAPRRFNVSLDVGDAEIASKMAGVLPSTTVAGTTITTSIPLPAQIPALNLLLPLDGSRAMTGDLDMGGNNIGNVNDVEITSSYRESRVSGVLEKDYVRLSTGISFAGILGANDGNKYSKPTCPSGLTAIPIVVPAGNSSTVGITAEANPIGAQYAWAQSLSADADHPDGSWMFNYKMAIYKNNAWDLNHQPDAAANFLAIYMKCM